ncbi:MAG: ATP-dependent helicase [Candidatus Eremiobacteraeota bacterium]|nr:ATP-dependent helicase [Candidatus Eremiobacteraeota bacterium]
MSVSTTHASTAALDEIVASPLDRFLAIGGAPASGKTSALLARAARAALDGTVLLASSSRHAHERLSERFQDAFGANEAVRPVSPSALAFEVLAAVHPGVRYERISDVRAAQVFEDVGARLFSLEWTEFVSAEIDPEISGLRTPYRFASAAFRLIRKLRGAHTSPEEFRANCLVAATRFYAKPPNFSDAALLVETKPKYRDSLHVSKADLDAQYAREIDLAKILALLYEAYVDSLVAAGCLTDADAVYEATNALRGGGRFERYRFAAIDDAQDLDPGEIALLEALFGNELAGVTVAGDPSQRTCGFAGARGDKLFEREPRITLPASGALPSGIAAIAARALQPDRTASRPDDVEFYRGNNPADEARFVAATAARLVKDGTPPQAIAVVTRHLDCVRAYADALLARGLDVRMTGNVNPFDYPAIADALAALWAVADPFRHDWLLRNLEAPWMALSDAAIGALCAEPAVEELQPALLPEADMGGDAGERPRGGWDGARRVRLASNVLRGDVDGDLDDDTRERLGAFRIAVQRWTSYERDINLAQAVKAILDESVLATLDEGARGRFDAALVAEIVDAAVRFGERSRAASLGDFLTYLERVADADADLVSLNVASAPSAVVVADVEAVKGAAFEHVFITDVRAGAFPRYYTPDAFVYSPSFGIVPKENLGDDAHSARTAKFTYALYRMKATQRYHEEERRAFAVAATRARTRLYVSAWGKATKGIGAPELFEELHPART